METKVQDQTTVNVEAPSSTTEALVPAAAAVEKLNKSLGKKTLADLVRARTRRSILLVDCSGSMGSCIKSGQRRIDVLRDVVKRLRETHPVPVAAFGVRSGVVLVGDSIPEPDGSTPVHRAIEFGKREGANHLAVVTDGCPDSESAAYAAADAFGGTIDTFFIGDVNDYGLKFAQELARRTGGVCHFSDLGKPKELESKLKGLLGSGE